MNIEVKIGRPKEVHERTRGIGLKREPRRQKRAVENGRSKELYKITKLIIGGAKKQSVWIKDKNGNIKTEKNDIMERRKEHFCKILNRDDPESPIREEIDERGKWRIYI